MNSLEAILSAPLVQAIGWALLHLLWQGTLIALICAVLLVLMRERSASARYIVGCAALAIMLAFPIATAWRVYEQEVPGAAVSVAADNSATARLVLSDAQGADVTIPLSFQTIKPILKQKLDSMFRPVVPWTFAGWLAGVLLLSGRFLGGWAQAQRLSRRAQEASEAWQQRLRSLSTRIQLTIPVRLLESARVEVPMVVGWLRPVVIMPVAALTGLTTQQLETILAHELAHIRRHDYLVNVLQGIVETLLFYHPAVWWLSHRIRVERENCCDDLAVSVCGNPVLYARALADLEELRSLPFQHVLAANGGSLKNRVFRLVTGSEGKSRCSYRWITGVSVFTAAALMLVVAPLSLLASRHTLIPSPPAAAAPPAAPMAPVPPVPHDPSTCPYSKHAHLAGEVLEVTAPAAVAEMAAAGDTIEPADMADMADMADLADVPDAPPPPDPPEPLVDVQIPDFDLDVDENVVISPALEQAIRRATASVAPAIAAAARVRTEVIPHIAPMVRLRRADVEKIRAAAMAQAAMVEVRGNRIKIKAKELKARAKCQAWDGHLTVDQLLELRKSGTDVKYVNGIRDLGYDNFCLKDFIALQNAGVTLELITQLKSIGLDDLSAQQLIVLAQQGVTPDYVRQLGQAGFRDLTVGSLIILASQGVQPDYFRQMRDAGFPELSASQVVRLNVSGVTPDYVSGLSKAGMKDLSVHDVSLLRAAGVTPEFVASVKASGLEDVSVRDLIRLQNSGMNSQELRELARSSRK